MFEVIALMSVFKPELARKHLPSFSNSFLWNLLARMVVDGCVLLRYNQRAPMCPTSATRGPLVYETVSPFPLNAGRHGWRLASGVHRVSAFDKGGWAVPLLVQRRRHAPTQPCHVAPGLWQGKYLPRIFTHVLWFSGACILAHIFRMLRNFPGKAHQNNRLRMNFFLLSVIQSFWTLQDQFFGKKLKRCLEGTINDLQSLLNNNIGIFFLHGWWDMG